MRRPPARRVLRTVLFTDIVGSTEMAARLGDKRWRRTVAAHNEVVRRELRRNHGREVDTAGDGFFSIFENPTDALRCAAAAVAAVHGLGLRIRAGIHSGEVEPAGGKVGGIAVHIGARLLALAKTEEVLVSGTVRELVAGSGHDFEDRGTHELRGVPGEWHVYALVLPQLDESLAVGAADDDDDRRARAVRRQRLVVGGLLAMIAVLVIALGGVAFLATQTVPQPHGRDTVVAFEAGSSRVLRGWHVGTGPAALALADGVLWVASIDAGTLSRIELAGGRLTSIGQAGARPSAIVVNGGTAWVADRYTNQLAVLNARDGVLLDRLEVHASAMTALGSTIWLADDLTDQLAQLDSATRSITGSQQLAAPLGPTGLATAHGALWIAGPRSAGLLWAPLPIDKLTALATDMGAVDSVAASGDNVWFASSANDQVGRVDGATGRVDMRASVCDNPVALAPTPLATWVACSTDRALWRVENAGTVTDRISLDAVPSALAADGERVWVALRAD